MHSSCPLLLSQQHPRPLPLATPDLVQPCHFAASKPRPLRRGRATWQWQMSPLTALMPVQPLHHLGSHSKSHRCLHSCVVAAGAVPGPRFAFQAASWQKCLCGSDTLTGLGSGVTPSLLSLPSKGGSQRLVPLRRYSLTCSTEAQELQQQKATWCWMCNLGSQHLT